MTYFEDLYEFDPTYTLCSICETKETTHVSGVCTICMDKYDG